MTGNQFSWLATAFFLVFSVSQIPGAYCLARIPVNVYLGCNMVLCGIAVACTAACNNYASIMVVRLILAIGEGSIAPSLSLVTMKWYTRQQSSKRYGIWYSGLGVGQIIGGLVSFGFLHVRRGTFGSWRGMFLTLGIINLIVATWIFLCLTDNPSSAPFLSSSERSYYVQFLTTENKTTINTYRFRPSQLFSALTQDVALWLIFLISALCSLPSGAITTFSATLITGFGYTAEQAALLNIPSGAVSITSSLLATWFVERNVPRSLAILVLVIPTIIGGALMSFTHSQAASLAGIWLINAITPILIVAMSWAQANCAGHTKRVVYNGMIMIAFGIGNICGPQTYRAKDAPAYWPAKVTILVAAALSGVSTLALLAVYLRRNKLRSAAQDNGLETEALDIPDTKISGFKYMY
ncbi:Thiamine pathway transporter THI73 [Grifola frondosa]|uniref:Thiamine pathway transporter THI73 n=1 Tax=Grifola frondosa TaxID=5627 RepID=A0A1C7LVR2_GRIFR|nr:Thiamine pathway transporter THI73 [Grifola frondosa]